MATKKKGKAKGQGHGSRTHDALNTINTSVETDASLVNPKFTPIPVSHFSDMFRTKGTSSRSKGLYPSDPWNLRDTEALRVGDVKEQIKAADKRGDSSLVGKLKTSIREWENDDSKILQRTQKYDKKTGAALRTNTRRTELDRPNVRNTRYAPFGTKSAEDRVRYTRDQLTQVGATGKYNKAYDIDVAEHEAAVSRQSSHSRAVGAWVTATKGRGPNNIL